MGPVHDLLVGAARRWPDAIAIRAGDRAWTFTELDGRSARMAAHLVSLGVEPGDRVALRTGNRIEFVIALHAVSRAGAASVLLSPAWKDQELDHALGLTAPVGAIVDGEAGPFEGLGFVVDVDLPVELPAAGADAPVDLDDEALLVFSSGTTGLPKAVRHSHRTIGAATEQWAACLGLGPDDRFQVATPPSHILGALNLLAAASVGASVRLHLRFDLDEELRCLETDRMTLEMAVAPIALALARHSDLERYDLSSLRYIMWCATPVTESVARTVTERTGVPFMTAYGASEVPVLGACPVEEPSRWRLDTAGLPPAGVELRVVDLASHALLPTGEVGEIEARSPATMVGYLPASATAEAIDDGWYRTGDVGWLEPEGWVHITDRSKEMIKVRGFQVAPAEIETVLHGHPAVSDCAVFGVPDDDAGEVPVAAVALGPGQAVDPAALQALVADTLAGYKRLADLVVVEEIPRLPSGKALRRTLRDAYIAGGR